MREESGKENCLVRCLKYTEDIKPYRLRGEEALFHKLFAPYEVLERKGNVLLEEGIDQIFNLVAGVGSIFYDNTNARVGVGDGTSTATPNQTELTGGTLEFNAMEAGFPSLGAQKIIFKSSFGDAEANFAWAEWGVDNGATSDKNMNRKVEALGTKSSGTWTLEVEISLS